MSKLLAQHDNDAIAKLINRNGHVRNQTAADTNIIVLATGSTPESPAQFRFVNDTRTYWTLTKYVANVTGAISNSTPAPTPTPVPNESPTTHHTRLQESNSPFDDDNGQRIWHQVDGKWKWYPASKHHVSVKRALPPDNTSVVNSNIR
jgi:hypothetical protein